MKAEADPGDQAQAEDTGRNSVAAALRAEAELTTRARAKAEAAASSLMEAVVDRGNLWLAYQRVVANKGAAGVDALTVVEFKAYLQQHWPTIKGRLLAGTYQPQPVRRVDIPKPQGGVRTLGIPTVVDRLIQQALHQVLQPIFEPTFSDASFGFRPGRNAHQALRRAQQYVASGKRWVVDIDLEQFFDRVNHDLLMGKLAAKIDDARVLTLIRRYLQAGMMADGLVQPRTEGTPQGGPLSPLLSNILLTDLDRELERRGHAFCRYADDCNIYVASECAGTRLMARLTQFLEQRLKLKGECEQECGGAAVAAEVSGLQHDVAPEAEAAYCGAELAETDGEGEDRVARCTWSQPPDHHWASQSTPAWVGGVFQACRHQASAGDV
jgi:group II intron reverse transcriptase/maturase